MYNTLYIDFDGTIVNTIKKITSLYDEDFSSNKSYEKIDWSDVQTWDFSELKCATREDIDRYFSSKRFFDHLEFMDNAMEVIGSIEGLFQICIVSIGSKENLENKKMWIEENIPHCQFIGVDETINNDKAHIDMSDGIFIDDSLHNLETSNAAVKIVFGDKYPWNENNEKYLRCFNWMDVKRYITKFQLGMF